MPSVNRAIVAFAKLTAFTERNVGVLDSLCSVTVILLTGVLCWKVAEYKIVYLDCQNVQRFTTIFSDERSHVMYGNRYFRRYTNVR